MLYVCSAGHRPQCLQLPGDAILPGLQQLRLTARSFFRHAGTQIGWTDLTALTALERFYRLSEIPFRVDRAFCGRQPLLPHGSGVSFDLGRALTEAQRHKLRCCAVKSGLFSHVLPEALSPDCVHVDCQRCCDLHAGDCGVFVFVLQRTLQRMDRFPAVCSGSFCPVTERAVKRLQSAYAQEATGIADTNFWTILRQAEREERR